MFKIQYSDGGDWIDVDQPPFIEKDPELEVSFGERDSLSPEERATVAARDMGIAYPAYSFRVVPVG